MRWTHLWLLAACLLIMPVALLTSSWARAAAAPPADLPEDERQIQALEQGIDQAREQLDEAARKLANLHAQMWQMETSGSRADRPMLGILLDDHTGSRNGLPLAGVTPDSGAEQAGLKAGDIVVSVNGIRLAEGGRRAMDGLTQSLAGVSAGDVVPVAYERDGTTHQTRVRTMARGRYMTRVVEEKGAWLESLQSLQDLEDLEALKWLEEIEALDGGKLKRAGNVVRVPAGLRLEDVSGELAGYFGIERGVLVLDTPSGTSTLKAGDIILALDGQAVTSADTALETLAGLKGEVAGQVKRQGRDQAVSLDATALNANQAVHVVGGDRRIRIQRLADGDGMRLDISVDD